MPNYTYNESFDINIIKLQKSYEGNYTLSFIKPPTTQSVVASANDQLVSDQITVKNGKIHRVRTYTTNRWVEMDDKINKGKDFINQNTGGYIDLGNSPLDLEKHQYTVYSSYDLPKSIVEIDFVGFTTMRRAGDPEYIIYDQPSHRCTYVNHNNEVNVKVIFYQPNGSDYLIPYKSFTVELSKYDLFYKKDENVLDTDGKTILGTNYTLISKSEPRSVRIKAYVTSENPFPNFQLMPEINSQIISQQLLSYELQEGIISQKEYEQKRIALNEQGIGTTQTNYDMISLKNCFNIVCDEKLFTADGTLHHEVAVAIVVENECIEGSIQTFIFEKKTGEFKRIESQFKSEMWYNKYTDEWMKVTPVPLVRMSDVFLYDGREVAEKEENNPDISLYFHDGVSENPKSTQTVLYETHPITKQKFPSVQYVPTKANDIFAKDLTSYVKSLGLGNK